MSGFHKPWEDNGFFDSTPESSATKTRSRKSSVTVSPAVVPQSQAPQPPDLAPPAPQLVTPPVALSTPPPSQPQHTPSPQPVSRTDSPVQPETPHVSLPCGATPPLPRTPSVAMHSPPALPSRSGSTPTFLRSPETGHATPQASPASHVKPLSIGTLSRDAPSCRLSSSLPVLERRGSSSKPLAPPHATRLSLLTPEPRREAEARVAREGHENKEETQKEARASPAHAAERSVSPPALTASGRRRGPSTPFSPCGSAHDRGSTPGQAPHHRTLFAPSRSRAETSASTPRHATASDDAEGSDNSEPCGTSEPPPTAAEGKKVREVAEEEEGTTREISAVALSPSHERDGTQRDEEPAEASGSEAIPQPASTASLSSLSSLSSLTPTESDEEEVMSGASPSTSPDEHALKPLSAAEEDALLKSLHWRPCQNSHGAPRYRNTPGYYCTYCTYSICQGCFHGIPRVLLGLPSHHADEQDADRRRQRAAMGGGAASPMGATADALAVILSTPATAVVPSQSQTPGVRLGMRVRDKHGAGNGHGSEGDLPHRRGKRRWRDDVPRCHLCREGYLKFEEALLHEWCCEGPAPELRVRKRGRLVYDNDVQQRYFFMKQERERREASAEPLVASFHGALAPLPAPPPDASSTAGTGSVLGAESTTTPQKPSLLQVLDLDREADEDEKEAAADSGSTDALAGLSQRPLMRLSHRAATRPCCEEGGAAVFSVVNPRLEQACVWCAINAYPREGHPAFVKPLPIRHGGSGSASSGHGISGSITPVLMWRCPPSLPGLPPRRFALHIPYGAYGLHNVHGVALYLLSDVFRKATTQLTAVPGHEGGGSHRLAAATFVPSQHAQPLLVVDVLHRIASSPLVDRRLLFSHRQQGFVHAVGAKETPVHWPDGLASEEFALCLDHLLHGRSVAVGGLGSKFFFLNHVAHSAELLPFPVVTVDASRGRATGPACPSVARQLRDVGRRLKAQSRAGRGLFTMEPLVDRGSGAQRGGRPSDAKDAAVLAGTKRLRDEVHLRGDNDGHRSRSVSRQLETNTNGVTASPTSIINVDEAVGEDGAHHEVGNGKRDMSRSPSVLRELSPVPAIKGSDDGSSALNTSRELGTARPSPPPAAVAATAVLCEENTARASPLVLTPLEWCDAAVAATTTTSGSGTAVPRLALPAVLEPDTEGRTDLPASNTLAHRLCTVKEPTIGFASAAARQHVTELLAKAPVYQRTRCVRWLATPSSLTHKLLTHPSTAPGATTEPLPTTPGAQCSEQAAMILVLHNADLLDAEAIAVMQQLCHDHGHPRAQLRILLSYDDPNWPSGGGSGSSSADSAASSLSAGLESMHLVHMQLRSLLLPRVHEMRTVDSLALLTQSEATAAGGTSGGSGGHAGGSSSYSNASLPLHDTIRRVLKSLPDNFRSHLYKLIDIQEAYGEGVYVSVHAIRGELEKRDVLLSAGFWASVRGELTSNRLAHYDAAENALVLLQPRKLRKVLDEVAAEKALANGGVVVDDGARVPR